MRRPICLSITKKLKLKLITIHAGGELITTIAMKIFIEMTEGSNVMVVAK